MSERIERWVNVYSDGSLGTFWDSPPPTLPHARVAHFVEIRDGESIAVNGETGRAFKVGDRVRLLPSCVNDDILERYIGATATIERSAEAFDFKLSLDNDQGSWCVNKENIEHIGSRPIPESELNAAIERAEKAEAEIERLAKDDQRYVPVKTLNEVQAMFDAEHKRAEKAECERAQMVQMLDVVREDVRGWMRRAMDESDRAERMDQQLRNANLAATVAGFQVDDAAAKFERWAAVRFRAVYLASLDGQFDAESEAKNLRSHYFPPAKEA